MLREANFEEEKVTEVNGVRLDRTTTAGKSKPAVPEDLEEGELEDEEGGDVQKTTIEQTPDQDGNMLEKVLIYISKQTYLLAWLIPMTGRVSYAT